MAEEAFGISEYMSDHVGFFGIIKQRYSDFQVNEIASSGEVVHLTSKEIIPVPPVPLIDKFLKPAELDDNQIEILYLISGKKKVEEVNTSVLLTSSSGADCSSKGIEELKIDVNEVSKENRALIHRYIKANFPNLTSTTKNLNCQKTMHVFKTNKNVYQDKRDAWAKERAHVHFVLCKENIDTIEAINLLSSKLRLKPGSLSYAGTKDRRAVTSQLVSVYQIPPENIAAASKTLHKIHVGNYFFKKKPQRLGQANGNYFKIVLREVKGNPEEIDKAIKSVQENGFINYFGMQRFSTSDVSTHTIGKSLLLGKWKTAVDLILSPRENDCEDLAKAKLIWIKDTNAHNACAVLKPFRRNSLEGQLLSGLASNAPVNFLNALQILPRNVKLMYLHAYQSFLWNHVVSRRLNKHKLRVLPGDLVLKKNKVKEIVESMEGVMEESCSENNERSKESATTSKIVHVLSEKEAQTVDITEVIMPMPGFSVVYPDNEIKQWYEDLLKKDDLSFRMLKGKVPKFSLSGAYRTMILRPQNLRYSSCFYDDSTKPLIQSDLEVMQNIDPTSNRLSEGKNKALILEFSLPSSTYATMLLREVLKMETSSKYHSSLNTNLAREDEAIKDTEGGIGAKRKAEAETGIAQKKFAPQ